MLLIERKSPNRLLPSGAVSLSQPISRVYLAMLAMTVVLVSDVFIPYFLQTLHGVAPLLSGYLVALVALGWTFAAFLSGSWTGRQAYRAIVIGALIEAAATASLAIFLASDNPEGHMLLIVPAAIGMLMMGFGIGLGWAHLVAMVLRLVADNEQDKASSAIPTMSSLGGAFGAAFSGVIANGAKPRRSGRRCRQHLGGPLALCRDGAARHRRDCGGDDAERQPKLKKAPRVRGAFS